MRAKKFVKCCRFGRPFATGSDCAEEIAKLLGCFGRETIEAVRDNIHAGITGCVELHCKPARVGAIHRIGNVRDASEVGEPHGDGNGGFGEERRGCNVSRLGRRSECAFQHDAFGMDRAGMMLAERTMERLDHLFGEIISRHCGIYDRLAFGNG